MLQPVQQLVSASWSICLAVFFFSWMVFFIGCCACCKGAQDDDTTVALVSPEPSQPIQKVV